MINIQLRGCHYHTSFALGTVQVQESGGREATSKQSDTDAPYFTHQLCGYEGQKLYNTSPIRTASREKWMDASRGRVCPSPVSLKTSATCRLELIKCGCKGHCSCKKNKLPCTALRKCHNFDCSNLPDYRMIADEECVLRLQKVNKDDILRRLCTTNLTH